ncbi:MAG: hypothetical protein Q6L50_06930, partial [Gloeomargarita sp. GMQP_bins_120]
WDNTVVIWEPVSGRCLRTLSEPFRFGDNGFNALALSADNQWLVTGNENCLLRLWDVNREEPVFTFPEQKSAVTALTFSPQGHLLVSGNRDGLIHLWDMGLRQQRATLKGHSKAITSLAFTPDGHFLLSGSRDNSVRIWQPQS